MTLRSRWPSACMQASRAETREIRKPADECPSSVRRGEACGRTPRVHGFRKSDGIIVVKKPANKRERDAEADRARAELVERRVPAEGNSVMASPVRDTEPGPDRDTELDRTGSTGLTGYERSQDGRVVMDGGWNTSGVDIANLAYLPQRA